MKWWSEPNVMFTFIGDLICEIVEHNVKVTKLTVVYSAFSHCKWKYIVYTINTKPWSPLCSPKISFCVSKTPAGKLCFMNLICFSFPYFPIFEALKGYSWSTAGSFYWKKKKLENCWATCILVCLSNITYKLDNWSSETFNFFLPFFFIFFFFFNTHVYCVMYFACSHILYLFFFFISDR